MHDRVQHDVRPAGYQQQVAVTIAPSPEQPRCGRKSLESMSILMPPHVCDVGREEHTSIQRSGVPHRNPGFVQSRFPSVPDTELAEYRLVNGPEPRPSLMQEANERPESGQLLVKDTVPSMGSRTQTNSAFSRSFPNSSPMMP